MNTRDALSSAAVLAAISSLTTSFAYAEQGGMAAPAAPSVVSRAERQAPVEEQATSPARAEPGSGAGAGNPEAIRKARAARIASYQKPYVLYPYGTRDES